MESSPLVVGERFFLSQWEGIEVSGVSCKGVMLGHKSGGDLRSNPRCVCAGRVRFVGPTRTVCSILAFTDGGVQKDFVSSGQGSAQMCPDSARHSARHSARPMISEVLWNCI